MIVTTTVVILTILVVLSIARVIVMVGEILLLVLIAAILSTGLSPVVEAFERRTWTRRRWRVPRTGAIILVYVGLLIVLSLIGSILITPLVTESREVLERAPELYRTLRETLVSLQQRYAWLPDLTAILDRLPQEVSRLGSYVGTATGVAFRVFGGVVSIVTVLILSFYMLLEGPAIKEGFMDLFPRRHHRQVETVLQHVGQKFGGWLRGQLFLGLIIGLLAGLGTWALGLPYPFLLGVAAGVTELVPLIGPVLGAIPAVLVALFGPTWRLLAVIVFFTFIQQAEGNFLVPRVMKQAVGLSPLLTLVAIMIGANLMGIIGALLAVPIAAALQVIGGEIVRTFKPSG
ncbi:MAG: AI-2E family transporter [Armatimonadota bacterium]